MVRYVLNTAYRDGTTHVVFEPGGLPLNSRCWARVTPASVRKFKNLAAAKLGEPDLTVSKRKGLCWANWLQLEFKIEVSICSVCSGPMKTTRRGSSPIVRPQYRRCNCNRQNIVASGSQKLRVIITSRAIGARAQPPEVSLTSSRATGCPARDGRPYNIRKRRVGQWLSGGS